MHKFLILIFMLYFATNSFDKSESVDLFDEIFGEGWWDNDKAEEWLKLTLEHNFHHEIDRQNTQIGQIEPNSTDQNPSLTKSDHSGQIKPNSTDQNPPLRESDHSGQIEPNSTDQRGQIEPNSTDQNPPLTEFDHSGQIESNSTDQNPPLTESDHSGQIEPNSTDQLGQIEPNSTDQNPSLTESDHSGQNSIIDKFHEIKDKFKQKGKYSAKEWVTIEMKIAKHLKVNRKKIYKWKKEFGLSRKMFYEKEERKHLIEKFDEMKAELKRAGFKNSYHNQINQTVAKELGLGVRTIYTWKRELGQTIPKHMHPHSEQKELMKHYYEIKDQNPKISVGNIAKMLNIGTDTLYRWKRQFIRQQFQQNSVDGHSVEENAAANVQEIGNSNSGSLWNEESFI